MSDTPKSSGLPRPVKVLICFASAVLAYTLTGFLIVPAVIKSQMVQRLPLLTHRQAAVREVAFNPYTFALTVGGLSLLETNGGVFAGFDRFHVQFQALASLSARAWVFKNVTVTRPVAHITRRKDGSFNFDNLLQNNPSNVPAPALPAIIINTLRVEDASLSLDDLAIAAPFHDKLAPINLQLTQFSTRSNAASPYAFSARTGAGGNITASGRLALQPPQSSGRVQLAGLPLKRYAPYLADFTTAEILDGKLDAGAQYSFSLGANGLEAAVTNGAAQLAGFQLKAPDSAETVLSIPMLSVDQAEASLAKKSARIRSVKSSGGSLVVRQDHNGTINLLSLLKSPPASAKSRAPAAAPWTAQIDEIAFDTYAVQIEDRKPVRPVIIAARDFSLKITGFNSTLAAPIALTSTMRLNEQGWLLLRGKVTLAPLSANLTFDLGGLDLPPFQPYLAGKVNVEITGGQLQARGKARYAAAAAPVAAFAGDASVTHLAATDPLNGIDLVKFDSLAVKGIDFALQPNQLHVQEIRVTGLDATVLVQTNRQINVLNLMPPLPASATSASSNALGPFPLTLDTLALDAASLHILDHSIEPNFILDVPELSGAVQHISTETNAPAKVDLRGRVGQFAPFTISGTVESLAKNLSLDLVVSCKNINLAAFTSYMEKYGGYPLKKGKLVLDLHYNVAGRMLTAANKIILDDLTLGPKNTSANAIQLPFKLGIALLKDRDGKIILDVPLTGSLDDPQFQVAPLVWKTIRKSLLKAAESPFSLLGEVVEGRDEEPSYVEFPPGSAALPPGEQAKIRKLSAALYERPNVNLEIAGAVDPSADIPALALLQFQRRIQQRRARELAAPPPADHIAPVSAGPPPAHPDLPPLERRLTAEIPVTDNDLRELMQARARAVQSVLLESGKVSADRVAILAPKEIDRSAKGETRANFSLE